MRAPLAPRALAALVLCQLGHALVADPDKLESGVPKSFWDVSRQVNQGQHRNFANVKEANRWGTDSSLDRDRIKIFNDMREEARQVKAMSDPFDERQAGTDGGEDLNIIGQQPAGGMFDTQVFNTVQDERSHLAHVGAGDHQILDDGSVRESQSEMDRQIQQLPEKLQNDVYEMMGRKKDFKNPFAKSEPVLLARPDPKKHFHVEGLNAREESTQVGFMQYRVDLGMPPEDRWNQVIEDNHEAVAAAVRAFSLLIAPTLPVGSEYRRDWLANNNFPCEYLSEVNGIASKLNEMGHEDIKPEHVLLFNCMYQLFAATFGTGILAANEQGEVYHAHNFDHPMIFEDPITHEEYNIRDFTYNIIFTKCGSPLYMGVMMAGTVGIHVGMRFGTRGAGGATEGSWTFQHLSRRQNDVWANLNAMKTGRPSFHLLVRKLMEKEPSYVNAVRTMVLNDSPTPEYYMMTGTEPYQGVLITKSRGGMRPKYGSYTVLTEKNWYLAMRTSEDLVGVTRDVSTWLEGEMDKITRDHMTPAKLMNLMKDEHLYDPLTQFTFMANAHQLVFETLPTKHLTKLQRERRREWGITLRGEATGRRAFEGASGAEEAQEGFRLSTQEEVFELGYAGVNVTPWRIRAGKGDAPAQSRWEQRAAAQRARVANQAENDGFLQTQELKSQAEQMANNVRGRVKKGSYEHGNAAAKAYARENNIKQATPFVVDIYAAGHEKGDSVEDGEYSITRNGKGTIVSLYDKCIELQIGQVQEFCYEGEPTYDHMEF